MKILHLVEYYHPSTGGMQEVVRRLSEALVRSGCEVTVATTVLPERGESLLNGVRIAGFAVSGKLATGISGEVERYRRFLLESDFDIITVFAAQQWSCDLMLGLIDRLKGRKVFVPTGFSELHHPRFKEYFRAMPAWMKQFDMNVFLSENYRDINFARENGVERLMVIPNGASEEEFLRPVQPDIRERLAIPHDHLLILHVGSHTGLKGHREALRIFAAAKTGNATLLLAANESKGGCGRSCRFRGALFNFWPKRSADGKRVYVRELQRSDVLAAYHAADLFLFPSNMECSPLVLFECMASQTPFLTTDVGNAAEIVSWSGGGIVLPTTRDAKGRSRADIAGSARVLEEVCHDLPLRQRLGWSGFAAWKSRFTWEKIAGEYEGLYRSLLGGVSP